MKQRFSKRNSRSGKPHVLIILLLLMLCGYATSFAQACRSQTLDTLHVNNINAVLNLGARLFNSDHFRVAPVADSVGPSTIYAAALWMAGRTPDGQFRLSVPDYSNFNAPAGPLHSDNTTDSLSCQNWDRMFRMQANTVNQFLADLPTLSSNPDLAIQQYPQIMGWPGRNNPYFFQIQGFGLPADKSMAPFADQNSDGIYNPLQGDYPVVALDNGVQFIPAEWLWNISNTWGQPVAPSPTDVAMIAEIQSTIWAFQCEEQSVLNRTIFSSQQVTYLGQEALDSVFLALWCDLDLGCLLDDYTGCAPELDAFFVYNIDIVDGELGLLCAPAFIGTPPVQSVVLLNKSLDKYISYNRAGSGPEVFAYNADPTTPASYYRYISGSWADGTPLTFGDGGYHASGGTPANHAFPGDPAQPGEWSMYSANVQYADRRAVGAHYVGTLLPGQKEELVASWSVNFDGTFSNSLEPTYVDMATLHAMYDQGFSNVCAVTGVGHSSVAAAWNVSPNPANTFFTIQYPNASVQEIRLFDATGRLAGQWLYVPETSTTIDTRLLPAGMYFIQIRTASGQSTQKVVVEH